MSEEGIECLLRLARLAFFLLRALMLGYFDELQGLPRAKERCHELKSVNNYTGLRQLQLCNDGLE